MKKLLVIMVAAVALAFGSVQQVNAQNDNGGLGVRFGGGDLLGAELSYLTKVDADNRWELDLGVGDIRYWHTDNAGIDHLHHGLFLGFTGSYQWHWNIVSGFNWFVGPAAQANFLIADSNHSDISLGVGGQIGLEYDFLTDLDVPLQLSLDLRPMAHFYLLGHYRPVNDLYQYFGWGVALGVRYIFH